MVKTNIFYLGCIPKLIPQIVQSTASAPNPDFPLSEQHSTDPGPMMATTMVTTRRMEVNEVLMRMPRIGPVIQNKYTQNKLND